MAFVPEDYFMPYFEPHLSHSASCAPPYAPPQGQYHNVVQYDPPPGPPPDSMYYSYSEPPQYYADYNEYPLSPVPPYIPQYTEDPYPPPQHIHAPIPVSAYSTLMPHISGIADAVRPTEPLTPATTQPNSPATPVIIRLCSPSSTPLPSPPTTRRAALPVFVPPNTHVSKQEVDDKPARDILQRNALELYGGAPQVLFPTPTQLLCNLAAQDRQTSDARRRVSTSSAHSSPSSRVGTRSAKQLKIDTKVASAKPSAKTRSSTSSSVASPARRQIKSQVQPKPSPAPPAPRPENIRKCHFRNVAEYVGSKLTDPDTITSHDKRRYYLESLERYVLWMHEQVSLCGHTPLQLGRTESYAGLAVPSIRKMLVYFQDEAKRVQTELKLKDPEFSLEDAVLLQARS